MSSPSILVRPSPTNPPQNRVLYRIYLGYRALLAVVFLLLLVIPTTSELVGALNPLQYFSATLLFLLSSLGLLGSARRQWQRSNTFLVLLFTFDIIIVIILADASGGMGSGLPLLLAIVAAASAVLISNRTLATLVAALAVLGVLSDTIRLISLEHLGIADLFPAGLLGLLLFAVSTLVQIIAARLGRAEALAQARTSDLYTLQRLNEQIVQSMQAGILLVDPREHVRIMNQAASAMLMPDRPAAMEQGRDLEEYSPELCRRLRGYRSAGTQAHGPFRIHPEGLELVPRFRRLDGGEAEPQTLIFLEDYSPVAQHAQSLKLGSLGRLTASIAHEIRNPLGAISHAAQLLDESPRADADDRRLLAIITANSRRVNEIVESVLQISRRQPPRPELLNLPEWLPGYLERYRAACDSPCRIALDAAPELQVEFDPENLGRVLNNLIDNALRHGAEKTGRRECRLHAHADATGTQVLVDVLDDGHGIDPEDEARLFEPFFSRSAGGSGMGLYLCRELCELNNANLVYHPMDTGETCFRIAMARQAVDA
ncbi:sensor histidine kinase [Pseudohaliea rubra]|uniref:histidine kinase n=1 Tax=Pseudohaliea rubra DSM 19751 TaxID=1265313 RepID=A0A095XVK9_9GAMM|nr:HAMP domain-containing sensor histidine kinase [Pseudohaliea rubra]KGE03721.1 Two-component sensor PilS [Pseudohaliea rubra DSM 19751]